MGRHDRTTVTVSELRAFDIEPTETGVAVPAISSFLRARRLIGAVLSTKKGEITRHKILIPVSECGRRGSLPKIKSLPDGISFVIHDHLNQKHSGRIFLELHIKTADQILVLPTLEPFKTKQAAIKYIHSVSAILVPDDCMVGIYEGNNIIETITNETLKGEVK